MPEYLYPFPVARQEPEIMIKHTEFSAQDSTASQQGFSLCNPLVHCMTNQVVQTLTANLLLAAGASPAMVIDPEEAPVMARYAGALLINVGTLTRGLSESMLAAVEAANQAAVPWTLDPVAVGVLPLRTEFARRLLTLSPAVIRGNGSEILALAGAGEGGRGMDSLDDSSRAVDAAIYLATTYRTIVVVSGETDYVTDGHQVLTVSGGSAMMTSVTGTGCGLSALVAAFSALPGERIMHVATACYLMSLAGERAAQQAAGPGSFAVHLSDALWQLCQPQTKENPDAAY